MNFAQFSGMLIMFTGAIVLVIGSIVVSIGIVRRMAQRPLPGQITHEELDEMRQRLAELEERDARVEELEQRVDFHERVLGRSREAPGLPRPEP